MESKNEIETAKEVLLYLAADSVFSFGDIDADAVLERDELFNSWKITSDVLDRAEKERKGVESWGLEWHTVSEGDLE